jgi:pimeloyl-ACP methyl ester carboxylesterase
VRPEGLSSTEQLVVNSAPNVRLSATLTLPPGASRAPVVIGVHGASSGVRNAPLFQHLSSTLPIHGIATFVFDRRGEGASTGPPGLASFEDLAADVRACVDVLAEHPAVDSEQIGLWAHSQGGWIAPLAAGASDRVRFIVAVAPSGVTAAEQMKYAAHRQVLLAGYSKDDADRAVAIRERIDDYYRGRVSRREADLLFLETRKEPWFGRIFLPDPSNPAPQWQTIMDFDIRPTLEHLSQPMLLIFGEDDRWVPIDATINVWREAVRNPEQVTIVRIAGAGHSMTLAEDPDDWLEEGPVSPDYERKLISWLTDADKRLGLVGDGTAVSAFGSERSSRCL